jgi:hypothetical protein
MLARGTSELQLGHQRAHEEREQGLYPCQERRPGRAYTILQQCRICEGWWGGADELGRRL